MYVYIYTHSYICSYAHTYLSLQQRVHTYVQATWIAQSFSTYSGACKNVFPDISAMAGRDL